MQKLFTLILLTILYFYSSAQYTGFEGNVPSNCSTDANSGLSMSDDHFKYGKQSLKWTWQPGSILTIDNPDGMQQALQVKQGGMMVWIYNESPINSYLRFEFSNYNTVQYWFDYYLNFKGWRACWIRFDEDMNGPKATKNLNDVKIIAPKHSEGGTFYFDRMLFPSKAIHNRLTPDSQLPYVNPEMNDNHWAAVWHWYKNYKYTLTKNEVSQSTGEQLLEIEKLLTKNAVGDSYSTSSLEKVKENFQALNIRRNEGRITGPAYVSDDEYMAANKDLKLNQAGDILIGLAKGWHFYKDQESANMFIDLVDHLIDQGWAVGSGMGTNHHYGYQFRKFSPSFLLMKKVLEEKGKLNEYVATLLYWCGVPELREEPVPGTLQGLIDSWNTMTTPRLMAICMQEDLDQRDLDFRSFKRWMEASLEYSPGTMGGIKPDGTGFHHGGLYPAYSTGGFSGVGEYIAATRGTAYQLNTHASGNLKQALQCMVNYSVHTDWGFGICGRHPLTGTLSDGLIQTIGELAACGNQQTGETIDKELASTYLRLTNSTGELASSFKKAGISAAQSPSGFFTYNYGALGIHRRNNWMLSLKGYNKYVWGSEIYTADNRFGRYQSYGTVQIMNIGEPVSAKASGFNENGWDWNRYPGATTIHLPLDQLESPYPGTLMEKSEETFAGALSLEGQNGIFGMKLKENDRPNFTSDFKARKSVFCFDNRIICLGSGISNSNTAFPTETVLFQSAIQDKTISLNSNEGSILKTFPSEENLNTEKACWFTDPNDNGYYLPAGQQVKLRKALQYSKHNKTEKLTSGDFISAWIDHGKAPRETGYEYAVFVNAGTREMKKEFEKLTTNQVYQIIRKDNSAHIVRDLQTGITGLVLFEPHSTDTTTIVCNNSVPCMVMYRTNNTNELLLSIVNPDLNLPDNSYTSNQAAQETKVLISVKGHWQLVSTSTSCKITGITGGNTQLEFTCINGLPIEIKLSHDNSTGLQQLPLPVFEIIPNPAQDSTSVRFSHPLSSDSSLTLSGLNGQYFFSQKLRRDTTALQIDLSDYPEGLYFVGLHQYKNNEHRKLLLVR